MAAGRLCLNTNDRTGQVGHLPGHLVRLAAFSGKTVQQALREPSTPQFAESKRLQQLPLSVETQQRACRIVLRKPAPACTRPFWSGAGPRSAGIAIERHRLAPLRS